MYVHLKEHFWWKSHPNNLCQHAYLCAWVLQPHMYDILPNQNDASKLNSLNQSQTDVISIIKLFVPGYEGPWMFVTHLAQVRDCRAQEMYFIIGTLLHTDFSPGQDRKGVMHTQALFWVLVFHALPCLVRPDSNRQASSSDSIIPSLPIYHLVLLTPPTPLNTPWKCPPLFMIWTLNEKYTSLHTYMHIPDGLDDTGKATWR